MNMGNKVGGVNVTFTNKKVGWYVKNIWHCIVIFHLGLPEFFGITGISTRKKMNIKNDFWWKYAFASVKLDFVYGYDIWSEK